MKKLVSRLCISDISRKSICLLVEPLRNQFLGPFFRLCYFLFLIPNFPFFYHLLYFYYSFFLWFFLPFSFFLQLLFSSSHLSFFLLSFTFTILVFSALISTIFHTLLDILSSLLLLFSSQSQDCGKPTIPFPKLHFTSAIQSYLSLFFPYAPDNKY